MRDTLQLIRKDNNDAYFRTAAASAGKVALSIFAWSVRIVQPNDVRILNLYKSIATNNFIPVSFRMRQCETFGLVLVLHRKTLDGYWSDCKQTRVVIRKITPPFLIIATLRICKCG